MPAVKLRSPQHGAVRSRNYYSLWPLSFLGWKRTWCHQPGFWEEVLRSQCPKASSGLSAPRRYPLKPQTNHILRVQSWLTRYCSKSSFAEPISEKGPRRNQIRIKQPSQAAYHVDKRQSHCLGWYSAGQLRSYAAQPHLNHCLELGHPYLTSIAATY